MRKASWNGRIVAESEQFELVEGNVYFPRNSIKSEYFVPSTHTTQCPWKGTASYFHLNVGGKENKDAAWYYPVPSKAAEKIKDYVAFWRGVEIT